MRKLLLALPLALGSALAATAQEAPAGRSPWVETRFHRVHLRNGNFIDGQLIQQTPKNVLLKLPSAGDFSVRRDMITRVEYIKMRSLREEPPIVTTKTSAPALEGTVVQIANPSTAPSNPRPQPGAAAPPRIAPAVRNAVDDLLLSDALSRREFRQPLAPRIRTLGPDAMAYACWVACTGRESIDRLALIEAVEEFDHPDALRSLISIALTAPDPADRTAAVQSLSRKSDPEARAALHRAAADPSSPVGRAAADAILKLSEKGEADVELLIKLLEEAPDKAGIVRVLGKVAGERAIEALQALVSQGAVGDKIVALQALGSSGQKLDGGNALDLIDHPDSNLRMEACAFLGRVKFQPAVHSLIEALKDEDANVLKTAHRALQLITGQTYGPSHSRWTDWWEQTGRTKFPAPQE